MRCNKHIYDLSGTIGVCASCLREHLRALCDEEGDVEDPRFSVPDPVSLFFPRSVSPYMSHRKSETASSDHLLRNKDEILDDRLFFRTPQILHTSTENNVEKKKKTKRGRRFSFLSRIFGSVRSASSESDPRISTDSVSSTTSWISKKLQQSNLSRTVCDWGMSPAKNHDDSEVSPYASGYSTEAWRTPVRSTAMHRSRLKHAKSVAGGLAFCLSPLVRASPGRQWNQKPITAKEGVFSGEFRVSKKAEFYLCPNRSRKLADLGRFSHNH